MKYFLNREESYKLDKFFFESIEVPSQVLMENAAHSVYQKILEIPEIACSKKILVLCGAGNNGGDGFALARYLSNKFEVEIYFNGQIEKMSAETLTNYTICKNLLIPILNKIPNKNYDIIIEALVGIGANENLYPEISNILQQVNNFQAIKIAIDSPAGLNINTGFANKNVFLADYTFTMFSEKLGLFINDGMKASGKVIAVNLGVPDSFLADFTKIKALEEKDIISNRKPRLNNSSKFDYGRIVIIAGSKNMLGAGVLSANAAIKAGAGLVHLISTERHSHLLPEVICHCFEVNKYGSLPLKDLNEILKITENADVIAIGPGISNDNEIIHLVHKIIEENQEKKIILDADALKCLDKDSVLSKNFILTPHSGEFARICSLERTYVEENRINLVKEWSKKIKCNILLKGSPTLISDGSEIYLNMTGNPALATAGSGDVLTGILAAIYARYDNPFFASAMAAYYHGKIADDYIMNYSKSSLTASNIIDELKNYEI